MAWNYTLRSRSTRLYIYISLETSLTLSSQDDVVYNNILLLVSLLFLYITIYDIQTMHRDVATYEALSPLGYLLQIVQSPKMRQVNYYYYIYRYIIDLC